MNDEKNCTPSAWGLNSKQAMSPIDDQINLMWGSIDVLAGKLDLLNRKLDPVRVDAPVWDNTAEETSMTLCGVAKAIKTHRECIDANIEKIDYLLDTLQV